MEGRPATYGGFIGLELHGMLPAPRQQDVPGLLLTSGRAGMAAILDQLRPVRVHVPYHTCDSLLGPMRARGIPIGFLPIDAQLHMQDLPTARPNELLVLIDHFGVRTDHVTALARAHGTPVALDLTHAFHVTPPPGIWAFNSLRKFFPVPDGGYMHAPVPMPAPAPPDDAMRTDHLVLRQLDPGAGTLKAYRDNESRMSSAYREASSATQVLMRHINIEAALLRRNANFAIAHSVLGELNRLELDTSSVQGPLCYPLLLDREVDLAPLHAQGLFIPRYWPDVLKRADASKYPVEAMLTTHLLAFPMDQRYNEQQVHEAAWEVRRMI